MSGNEFKKEEINKKSISYFKLQYHFLKGKDYFFLVVAILGSFGTGISLPLFSLFFGKTISDLNILPLSFKSLFFQMFLNFIYVGISTLIGGVLMYTCWTYIGKTISRRLKEQYFNLIMQQDQSWFDQTNTFENSFKIQNQIKAIEEGVGDKVGHVYMAVSMFISSFIVGYYTSWKLSLVVTSIVPFFICGALIVNLIIKGKDRKLKEFYEKAGGIAEEILYQIKTVASFANFKWEVERFNKSLSLSYRNGINYGIRSSIFMGIYFLVIFLTFALAFWFGSVLIYEGEPNPHTGLPIAIGEVLVVVFTVIFGSLALGQATPNLKSIKMATVAASDFFELMERVPMIDLNNSTQKPDRKDLKGRISFNNVSFYYPLNSAHNQKQETNTKQVFNNISCVLEPGKKTAVIGENGSGKSTFANLIERFYDVSSGQVTIDGIDIKNYDINYLRSFIGYATQEPILFNTSIRENIKFGREDITDEDIINALKLASAYEFVSSISNGIDYVVGFKGSKLSGGQKQRIAIARAIVKKPKILILDESTSALDFQTEKIVQETLDNISKNITTIVIANRLSTIINSDKILVLNKGVIAEEGTHKDLFSKNGIYTAMMTSQVSEMIQNDKKATNLRSLQEDNLKQYQSNQTNFKNEVEQLIVKEKSDKVDENINKEIRQNLKPYLKEDIWNVIFAGFFSICTGAIWPAYGILLASTVTSLGAYGDKLKRNGETTAGWFCLLAILACIFQALQNYFLVVVGENLTNKVRKNLFHKYMSFSMEFFDKPENSAGSLLTRLNSDTAKINGIAISMVGVSLQMISSLIVGLIISFIYSWQLALVCFGFIPFAIICIILMWKAQNRIKISNETVESESGAILTDSICNSKTVFAFNMQQKVCEMFNNILKSQEPIIFKSAFCNGLLFGAILLIMFFSFGTLFLLGSKWIFVDLSVTRMLSSIFPVLFAIFGLTQGQQYVGDMSKTKEAVRNIFKILNEKSMIDPLKADDSDKKGLGRLRGKIEFRNVIFFYPQRPNQRILNNVSFIIQPGQNCAIVGFSGSGKSTIFQLIERFYEPSFGQILIDDIDIKNYDIISLRKSISFLMEEPSLFKRNVIENIQYGKLDATREEIELAAQKACIGHFLSEEKLLSDLPVSGGEKQRICLARAIIKDPSIFLLDEPTAALDKNSEESVQKTIDEMCKGRTAIQIAHRLSTIKNCDQIFVMENGQIMEQGNHEELYSNKGKYYLLYTAGISN